MTYIQHLLYFFSVYHRFDTSVFESRNQILVIVDARLIDLTDAVRQNASPRYGETVVRHLSYYYYFFVCFKIDHN